MVQSRYLSRASLDISHKLFLVEFYLIFIGYASISQHSPQKLLTPEKGFEWPKVWCDMWWLLHHTGEKQLSAVVTLKSALPFAGN